MEINTNELRLIGLETKSSNGNIDHLSITYDNAGRIDHISTYVNNETPTVTLKAIYNTNEVILASPVENNSSITATDTIRLYLDGNKRITKRLQNSFYEFKAPVQNPQRTYINDTTTYEYDEAGLPVKEVRGNLDTTWFNPGTAQSITVRMTSTTNYVNNNGNVASISNISNYNSKLQGVNSTIISSRSTTTSTSFEYSKSFVNKTDFNNAAILNELHLFNGLPINSAYKNIPDKITFTQTDRDQNGSVTSSTNFTTERQFTYNKYGLIATSFSTSSPNETTTYIYNK